jgi:hypothetical protein
MVNAAAKLEKLPPWAPTEASEFLVREFGSVKRNPSSGGFFYCVKLSELARENSTVIKFEVRPPTVMARFFKGGVECAPLSKLTTHGRFFCFLVISMHG